MDEILFVESAFNYGFAESDFYEFIPKAKVSEVHKTMRKLKPKSKKQKIPSLGKKATDQEIIEWATRHDPFDRLEAGISTVVEDHSDLDELLEKSLYQENSAQLNMRVPPALRTLLTKLARERTTDATTLARIWLAERIRKELGEGRK